MVRLDELTIELGIDFTNTISWRTSAHPEEWLQTPAGVLNWLEERHLLDSGKRKFLEHQMEENPAWATAFLKDAKHLREAGRELMLGLEDATSNLEVLNRHLQTAEPGVVASEGEFHREWPGAESLEQALWPVAYSMAELLTSELVTRVRECEGEGCGWLFLDLSKNRSRKWCDMADCGNRAKARRHYARVVAARKKRQQAP
jgi:predicted RNA-binding Zn ribbon-like protein